MNNSDFINKQSFQKRITEYKKKQIDMLYWEYTDRKNVTNHNPISVNSLNSKKVRPLKFYKLIRF